MTDPQFFFYVVGVGATAGLATQGAVFLVHAGLRNLRARRERALAIDGLIRSARVSSWWLHPVEPKGRG